ncbi:thioredoxin domain-containing protein [Phormidesmis sp. 146-12]
MKKHLKSILLMGVSVVGVASVAGYSFLSNAGQRATDNTQVSQAMQASDHQPIDQSMTVAQASNSNKLAAQLQGKPTIVKIYADWCPACQRLRPVTESLQQQFGDRANFVVFDVTNRTTTQAAEARARELGLSDFLAAHRSQTSTVAIINPSNGQTLTQFRYNFNQPIVRTKLDSDNAVRP